MIAYLHVLRSSKYLSLDNHCPGGDCTCLASQIEHCKSKGIKVLLSVEVDFPDDSESLAKYLLDNFLSGKAGPLGPVALDGIDLANFGYNSSYKWEELVRAINASTQERKIYLSAAPICSGNHGLDGAIKTGLFDYIWVLYYGNFASCEYLNDDATNLIESWKNWTSSVLSNNSVYLGLVASNDSAAASSGYIKPEVLLNESKILPTKKEASNYGGVMLWNRYYDKETGYSGEIKDALGTEKVCECICKRSSFNSLSSKSLLDGMFYRPS